MSSVNGKIGFIGSGNMAGAIARGIVSRGLVTPDALVLSDADHGKAQELATETGGTAVVTNRDLAAAVNVIILATKPFHVVEVCQEIKDLLSPERHVIMSICAGISTATMEEALGGDFRVVRVMPNTPALIGCGSAGICGGQFATDEDLDLARAIFDSVGVSVILPEEKLDLVTGLTGSGPAYVFRFMEALIQAGQDLGLSKEETEILVPTMVLGAARLAVESDKTLVQLREAVTTKGGTTAAGLHALEEGDFLELIHDCVAAATRRSQELGAGK